MSKEAGHFLWIKNTEGCNTSFEEDLNRLDRLSLMGLIKGLPTLS